MKLTAESTLKGIAIALGAVVVLMAGQELQRALEDDASPQAVNVGDPLKRTLQRCRKLTPEELAMDTECQAAWAENRRRFFGQPDDNQSEE